MSFWKISSSRTSASEDLSQVYVLLRVRTMDSSSLFAAPTPFVWRAASALMKYISSTRIIGKSMAPPTLMSKQAPLCGRNLRFRYSHGHPRKPFATLACLRIQEAELFSPYL